MLTSNEDQCKDLDIAEFRAAIGSSFNCTSRLIAIKFKEVMTRPDKDKWIKSVQRRYKCMVDDGILKVVDASQVKAEGKQPITSTWYMKKKLDRIYRTCLVARGFQQIEGQYYDTTAISSPGTIDTAIQMVLTIMLVAG